MSNPIWFAYVPVAFMATLLWVRRLTSQEPWNWSRVLLFASIIFAIHFYLPFYVLGLCELIFKYPAIQAPSATILCLLIFFIGWIVWGRYAAQFKEGEVISDPTAVSEPQPSTRKGKVPGLGLAHCTRPHAGCLRRHRCDDRIWSSPRGFEPISYHLPIGVYIFQTGSLNVLDHAYMHTFPANASIWYGYWLALGSERITAISNLVFLVPLGAGLNEIGRALGVNRAGQDLTLCGFLTIPLVSFSAFECGADVGGIAWLACALGLALTKTTGQISRTALTGICLGLAYGI